MGFVKYLINKSGRSYRIVNDGIQTLVNMSNYHEPTWHFDATFVPGPHQKRGKPAQYYIDLEMSSYKCPYDLAYNKVTAIYFVYQIRKYDGAGPEDNYLVLCVSSNNYYRLCFVKDEWGKNFILIWGIQGKKQSYYKDIHTFPTSANDPCEIGRWNVACIVFDIKTPSNSSLWVNHGKICNFTSPLYNCELHIFNNIKPNYSTGFNGYVIGMDFFSYFKSIPEGLTQAYMTFLCEKFNITPLPPPKLVSYGCSNSGGSISS